MEKTTVPAGQFKAQCLQLMKQVALSRQPLTITKHDKPIAQLVSLEQIIPKVFGALAGSATIKGDVLAPLEETWNAEQ